MSTKTLELKQRAQEMIKSIEQIELENNANIVTLKKFEDAIESLKNKIVNNQEALDIATHALELIRGVSDEVVQKAYKFLETNINAVLERTFTKSIRRIHIDEYLLRNQYPQLKIELDVGNGVKRTLKGDSGHGIAQIVSLLSVICLIMLTGSRRILVMDEIISGVSAKNKEIISEIMWSFTEVGFQFIIIEHGFIPRGAQVYELEMTGNVSKIINEYIEEKGVYKEVEPENNKDTSEEVDGDFNGYEDTQSFKNSIKIIKNLSEIDLSLNEEDEEFISI